MKHIRILAALMALLLLAGPVSACAEILTLPMDFSGGTVYINGEKVTDIPNRDSDHP